VFHVAPAAGLEDGIRIDGRIRASSRRSPRRSVAASQATLMTSPATSGLSSGQVGLDTFATYVKSLDCVPSP